MMRRMFHHPVPETEWTVWFDDDSRVMGPNWVVDLALAMERAPEADRKRITIHRVVRPGERGPGLGDRVAIDLALTPSSDDSPGSRAPLRTKVHFPPTHL